MKSVSCCKENSQATCTANLVQGLSVLDRSSANTARKGFSGFSLALYQEEGLSTHQGEQ